jgi:hypothetical protein
MTEKDTRTLLERAEAWNRGDFDAFPHPEDPDDVTLAQPKRPTTPRSTPRSSGTRIASSSPSTAPKN